MNKLDFDSINKATIDKLNGVSGPNKSIINDSYTVNKQNYWHTHTRACKSTSPSRE